MSEPATKLKLPTEIAKDTGIMVGVIAGESEDGESASEVSSLPTWLRGDEPVLPWRIGENRHE